MSVVVLAALVVLSVLLGSKLISPADSWHALTGAGGQNGTIVRQLRVPRTVLAVITGVALGLGGALMQALTRNPLADPGILGVNAGAALAVVVGITWCGVSSISGYVWFAFAGALLVTAAVYVIGSAGRGPASPLQLTLAGVALGAVLAGITSSIIIAHQDTFAAMRSWNVGSFVSRGLNLVAPVLAFVVLGVVLAIVVARPLNALALGEDLAAALGAHLARTRVLTLVAVTLLVGSAVALAGPIGFVGLIVPHLARWTFGPDQRWILPYSAVFGACLLLAADILGRVVMPPSEVPVGVVTAFIGAPMLIVLARRRKASGL